jgi:manganese/zinc/iron transport system ATP- binding protein
MNDLALSVNDLTVAYRDKPVLWDVDLEVPKGVMMAIVGPNGAGKSTLIKSVLGLVKSVAGNVLILGDEYKKVRKRVAYVPQRTSVDWDFPTTVIDVVMMGTYSKIGWIKRPGAKEKSLALNALKRVGMEDFANRQINELSGGQQQRTFLARALVQEADIYFLDEPLAGVDAKTEKAIIQILKEIRDDGKTIISVHHELMTVKEYFDYITLLNVRIIATGKVSDTFNAENIKTTYGGHNNIWDRKDY